MTEAQLEIKTVSYKQQLQSIQKIRIEVFQREQGVAPELEFDGLDEIATHLLAYINSKPVGTLRIREIKPKTLKPSIEYGEEISPLLSVRAYPPNSFGTGDSLGRGFLAPHALGLYRPVKIERLAVLNAFRNRGIGKKLMLTALAKIAASGDRLVVVHAQEYIKKLYQQLGFQQVGATFEEAGISHVKMTKQL